MLNRTFIRPLKLPERYLQAARELREETTDAENLLWLLLRDRRLAGLKFRRQHAIPPYILDFYCSEASLAVELDGSQHGEAGQKAHDQRRSLFLKELGIRVIRFWNNEVLIQTESVLETIYQEGNIPHPPFGHLLP